MKQKVIVGLPCSVKTTVNIPMWVFLSAALLIENQQRQGHFLGGYRPHILAIFLEKHWAITIHLFKPWAYFILAIFDTFS